MQCPSLECLWLRNCPSQLSLPRTPRESLAGSPTRPVCTHVALMSRLATVVGVTPRSVLSSTGPPLAQPHFMWSWSCPHSPRDVNPLGQLVGQACFLQLLGRGVSSWVEASPRERSQAQRQGRSCVGTGTQWSAKPASEFFSWEGTTSLFHLDWSDLGFCHHYRNLEPQAQRQKQHIDRCGQRTLLCSLRMGRDQLGEQMTNAQCGGEEGGGGRAGGMPHCRLARGAWLHLYLDSPGKPSRLSRSDVAGEGWLGRQWPCCALWVMQPPRARSTLGPLLVHWKALCSAGLRHLSPELAGQERPHHVQGQGGHGSEVLPEAVASAPTPWQVETLHLLFLARFGVCTCEVTMFSFAK